MERYKNIQDYLDNNNPLYTRREDLKESILRSALALLGECAHNFGGDAQMTEDVSQPLFFLNEIIDKVE